MTFELFPKLSQKFSQLFDDADDYNVIIKAGKNQNIKEFYAHSSILRSRSLYFKRALSQNLIAKKNDMINFTKPNISPIVFEMIIRYIYSGVLDLREKFGSDIFDLLITSGELLFEELAPFIQMYLIIEQTEWLQNNFDEVMQIAFQLENCELLQDYCLGHICKNLEPFFNSPNFLTLERSILLKLIKREDLQLDETELWDYLIKWGIAQTTELRGKDITDLSGWNEKDFLILKNTLNQFILHILFSEISLNDFNNKIMPYKKLLPKTLLNDILSFHKADTEPEGKIAIDSKIIKSKHAAILANWIQRKEANIQRNETYNFNLIYRGSRDGYNINTIRKKCNEQGASILVIKIEGKGTIIGGYNPVGWKYFEPRRGYKLNWINTTESYIFSLGHRNGQNKISRVIDSKYAIYEPLDQNNDLFFCTDLHINYKSGSCYQKNYESSILDIHYFSIEEMEIFAFTIQ